MMPILSVSSLSYSYHSPQGETKVLDHLSFSVRSGEFLAIVGPSGCGKSTLLSLLSGLSLPETGSILLNGKPVKKGCPAMGYMFQKDHLFEWRTIFQNVTLGLEVRKQKDEDHLRKAEELLRLYGLFPFAKKHPSELSGGMKQRAALIRTLVLEPEILLLDEPFSSLDHQTRLFVCDDIFKIIREQHKTVILITHDLSEAVSFADRILVLTDRPASVKSVFPVHFEKSGLTPLERRKTPEFSTLSSQLWELLQHSPDQQEVDHG